MEDTRGIAEGERIVTMRLQRFLARAGVASRRGSEGLMSAGRVTVNGEVVSELGSKVNPECDEVRVDGELVQMGGKPIYLILNKPAGFITTMDDPQGRPTVAELVADAHAPGLFPVGRLDMDTTGLLLFSTDGQAGQVLLRPRYHVDKHYVALVEGIPTEADLDRLRTGIVLDDGPCSPAEVELYLNDDPHVTSVAPTGIPKYHSVCGIRIHEGRKHQVKRMFSRIGHSVCVLHRDEFGPLSLVGVKEGHWRMLTEDEMRLLLEAVETRQEFKR